MEKVIRNKDVKLVKIEKLVQEIEDDDSRWIKKKVGAIYLVVIVKNWYNLPVINNV